MPIAKLTSEAEQGNSESQYLLGRAYDEGTLVPRNLIEAISWYQKAADQGHPLACVVLGIECPPSGTGTTHAAEHRITKIYGPPGTGKTTKLVELIRQSIGAGVEPHMIGFFSFTNKATEEAKSRMVTEFPQFDIEADFPYFQTIHSLANKALQTKVKVISDRQAKEFDPNVQIERPFMKEGDESSQVVRIKHPVLDAATTARALKKSFKDYLEKLPPSQRWPINKWLGLPFKLTRQPISVWGIESCIAYNDRYEAYKRGLDVIDFADMLDRAIINKMSLPELKLLLIDEAQDLSPAQWDIADALIAKADKVVIAGDDDQAICESFGASAKHFLDTKGHEVVLEVSRRIPIGVHQHLSHLIPILKDKSPSRKEKIWHPKDDTNHGEVFKFYSSKNFLAFLLSKITKNPQNDVLLMFVTNGSLQRFSGRLEANGVSHYAANELVGMGTPNIRLLTIWGAKGGQAHTTALITENGIDETMLHEDPRLEYVAHSRAIHSFYYVRSEWTSSWKPNVPQHPADHEQPEAAALKSSTNNLSVSADKNTTATRIVEPANLQELVNKFSRSKRREMNQPRPRTS